MNCYTIDKEQVPLRCNEIAIASLSLLIPIESHYGT